MDDPAAAQQQEAQEALPPKTPPRTRIGGKLVDEATQRELEELIEEARRWKAEAELSTDKCAQAHADLRKAGADLVGANTLLEVAQ